MPVTTEQLEEAIRTKLEDGLEHVVGGAVFAALSVSSDTFAHPSLASVRHLRLAIVISLI
jgi:hypothetical protein